MRQIQDINNDSNIKIYYSIINAAGLEAGMLFGLLESEDAVDKYVPLTHSYIEDECCISPYRQREEFRKLEELHLISTKYGSYPIKKFYKINSCKFFLVEKEYAKANSRKY